MAPVWILLLLVQLTHGYDWQKRSRALEVEEEGSGMDDTVLNMDREDMMVEVEENEKSLFASLFGLGTKVNKILFDDSSPVQYVINYDYSEVIESVKSIANFFRGEDSPVLYIANFDYQALLERITPSFATGLIGDTSDTPNSSVESSARSLNEVAERGVVDSVKQFALMAKDWVVDLFFTVFSLVFAIPVALVAGITGLGRSLISEAVGRGGRNLIKRIRERDDYFLEGIRTARSLLGAQGFDEEVLDKMAAGVMKAVDTYTMLQDLKGFQENL